MKIKFCKHLLLEKRDKVHCCIKCNAIIFSKLSQKNLNLIFKDSDNNAESIIIENMLQEEHQPKNLLLIPSYIKVILKKIRSYLVDYIKDIAKNLKISNFTTHFAIFYLDNIIMINEREEKSYWLNAFCCLIIASKFNEEDSRLPSFSNFNKQSKHSFTLQEIKSCEKEIINKLKWKLKVLLPKHFTSMFLLNGIVFETEKINGKEINSSDLKCIEKNIKVLELIIMKNYDFIKYRPSITALSTIVAARKVSKVQEMWNSKISSVYSIDFQELNECVNNLTKLFYEGFHLYHGHPERNNRPIYDNPGFKSELLLSTQEGQITNSLSEDVNPSFKFPNHYQKTKLLEDLMNRKIKNSNTTKSNELSSKLNIKYFKLNDTKSQIRIANTSLDPLRDVSIPENCKSINNISLYFKKDSLSFAERILKKIHERDQIILPNLGRR